MTWDAPTVTSLGAIGNNSREIEKTKKRKSLHTPEFQWSCGFTTLLALPHLFSTGQADPAPAAARTASSSHTSTTAAAATAATPLRWLRATGRSREHRVGFGPTKILSRPLRPGPACWALKRHWQSTAPKRRSISKSQPEDGLQLSNVYSYNEAPCNLTAKDRSKLRQVLGPVLLNI